MCRRELHYRRIHGDYKYNDFDATPPEYNRREGNGMNYT
jgi:hypothetical protein